MKKDFISIKDLSAEEISQIFSLTDELKKGAKDYSNCLKGKSVAMVFQKPSNRTRVSFEVGIFQLGGNAIYLGPDDIKLGVREATKDVASVLSRYVDAIVARTFSHQDVLDLAEFASVPVINGLSDLLHPCQALADFYTVREKKGDLSKINFAFVGDGNNVLNSLLHCAEKLGVNLAIATPKGYEPAQEIIDDVKKPDAKISISNDPKKAVSGADVVYTDVWTSMGQEKEYKKRLRHFKKFQINSKLLSLAKKDCIVMHCLPAHRGEEITDEILDGPNSVILVQAENRTHVQKAILISLM